jgi:large subunit ribosomal protein L25
MTVISKIEAEIREAKGKGAARSLRRAGRVPAIIYGNKEKEVLLSFDSKEITKYASKAGFYSHLIDIQIGKNSYRAIPYDVQLHPVTDQIEHIDFMHIGKNAEVKVSVHVHAINHEKCMALKRGGILNMIRRDIEISCKADDIPEKIDLDISNLTVSNALHVSDLILPKGVKAVTAGNVTIATISGSSKEEEEAVEQ